MCRGCGADGEVARWGARVFAETHALAPNEQRFPMDAGEDLEAEEWRAKEGAQQCCVGERAPPGCKRGRQERSIFIADLDTDQNRFCG